MTGAGSARGLEDGAGALVVGREQVHRHGPVEDQVVRAPEAAVPFSARRSSRR